MDETTPFGPELDYYYMQQALAQARTAAQRDEVPVGALIVAPDKSILSRGHNQVEQLHTQAAHAELQALKKAGKKNGDWRFDYHWIYVTLEPCAMCMNMIKLSRLEGVVFGAMSPLFGNHLDKNTPVPLYKRGALKIIADVGAQEAGLLLKTFFQKKRIKGG
jgi:tRNA(adenine34) deaminase